jgi:hypothetical protein
MRSADAARGSVTRSRGRAIGHACRDVAPAVGHATVSRTHAVRMMTLHSQRTAHAYMRVFANRDKLEMVSNIDRSRRDRSRARRQRTSSLVSAKSSRLTRLGLFPGRTEARRRARNVFLSLNGTTDFVEPVAFRAGSFASATSHNGALTGPIEGGACASTYAASVCGNYRHPPTVALTDAI